MNKQETYEYLTSHRIRYEVTEHAAVYNMAELGAVELPYPDRDAKNLFVRDDKKRNYYLITVTGDKRVDLKAFRKAHGLRNLSFASSEDLFSIMELLPGAVTPLGLLNDAERRVTLYIDEAFCGGLIGVHPNDNTAAVWLIIMNAVSRLMEEKSYMDITVTDIVKKASVARASFYRNFNSINDVIDAIADEISEELLEDVFPTLQSTDERKWREFLFNHFYLSGKRQKEMKNMRFENMSVIFTRMDNRLLQKESLLPGGTIRDKYLAAGKLGLINSITKQWMDTGAEESPEEMIDFIMSFITKF